MNTTLSFLTQDETTRRFAAIPTKRDRALFLIAYCYGVDTPAVLPRLWVPWEASQVVIP